MLLLTTEWFLHHYRDALEHTLSASATPLQPILLPAEGSHFDDDTLARLRVAFFHGDFRSDPGFTRRFFGTCLRAPGLKWMHLPNSGVDDPVFARLLDKGVRLSNSPGAAAEPIAVTAIAGMLMLARGFPGWMDAQRRRRWEPHEWSAAPADLAGESLLIVGVGAIGSRIAQLADAFGLRVTGVRRSATTLPPGVAEIVPPAQLADALSRTDWLVLACPLNDDTRGLIGEAALAAIKPGARLVNVSRGEVVEEPALIRALRERRLGGAYLDVFATEPLAGDSPLWDLPNVIITPHDSSASRGNPHRVSRLFLDNLGRWLAGGAIENEVRGR